MFSVKDTLTQTDADSIKGIRPTSDIRDPKNDKVIVRAGEKIGEESAKKIGKLGLKSLEVFVPNRYVDATLDQDPTHDADEALIDIYHRSARRSPRRGQRHQRDSYFFDTRRYDLAKVGRYKLNKKLGLRLPEHVRAVTREDLIKIIYYIIGLSESGWLTTHFNMANLSKRLPELEEAVKAEQKKATKEEKAAGDATRAEAEPRIFAHDPARHNGYGVGSS